MTEAIKYKIILQQFKNKIYSYSYYLLRDKMDADDVTQEVLVAIWKNIDGVNAFSVKKWIMTTTHNKCLDMLRKRSLVYQRQAVFNYDDEEEITMADEANRPDTITEKKIEKKALLDAIEKLPDVQKHALLLYEIHGFKYKEISEILKLPVNTLKVYLLRARQNLLKQLKAEEV
ncbi:MAG: sigma-70 family RNA polymerase sigma factor [Ignavibacteriales bacterium]|nr:MAG: sigma-70 family RNA polymerase sigma factor [Ignavibacteriales bacterium]